MSRQLLKVGHFNDLFAYMSRRMFSQAAIKINASLPLL